MFRGPAHAFKEALDHAEVTGADKPVATVMRRTKGQVALAKYGKGVIDMSRRQLGNITADQNDRPVRIASKRTRHTLAKISLTLGEAV